jgi:hypothetical protein
VGDIKKTKLKTIQLSVELKIGVARTEEIGTAPVLEAALVSQKWLSCEGT